MKNYTVILLSPAVAREYRALRLRALTEGPDLFAMSREEYANTSVEDVAKQLVATEQSFAFGAFCQDQTLVGMAEFHRGELFKVRHMALISAVYVVPEKRKKGIGRALMEATMSRARSMGDVEWLKLVVAAQDRDALELYRKLGFETYGMEPDSLKLDGGGYVVGEMMRLDLHASAA